MTCFFMIQFILDGLCLKLTANFIAEWVQLECTNQYTFTVALLK